MVEFPLLGSVFAIFFLTLLVGGTSQRSRLIVVCAYLVRVAMCYLHAYTVVLPDSQFDAVRFESVAWSWGRDQKCIDDFTTGSLLYSWIGSCVYSLFGRAALLLQVLNAFFGTLIVLVSMRTVRLLAKNRRVDQFVGWVLAIYPTLVLYSAITMREVAVVLTFCLSIYSLVRWRTGGRFIYGVLAVSWMIISQLFHTGMLTGTVLVMCVFLYYTVTDHWRRVWSLRVTVHDARVRFVSIIVVAAFAIAGAVMVSGGYGLEKVQRLATEGFLEALSGWQEQVARGRAGYLLSLQADNLVTLALQIPLRVVYFMGAPFPWDISILRDAWGSIDGVFLLAIFVAIVRQYRNRSTRRTEFRMVALIVILMIVGFALVTSNYGTAFRHRGKFVPVLIVLYGCGVNLRRREQRPVADIVSCRRGCRTSTSVVAYGISIGANAKPIRRRVRENTSFATCIDDNDRHVRCSVMNHPTNSHTIGVIARDRRQVRRFGPP